MFILTLFFLLCPRLPVALSELAVGVMYAFLHFVCHVTYTAFWVNIYPDSFLCLVVYIRLRS